MRYIYSIIPIPVIVTKRFISTRFSAVSLGIAILILPEYKDNEALVQHELTHCRQFYRTLGLHALLYWLSKKWRYKSELEAWRVQIDINPKAWDLAVKMLLNSYNLDRTEQEIKRDLR